MSRDEYFKRTHGRSGSSEHSIWKEMRQRCLNSNHRYFARYGGRGITISSEWDSFESFLADMGPRPEGHSLDRINNDGPYSPANCRWSNPTRQARNTSKTLRVIYRGQDWVLRDLCDHLGVPTRRVFQRMYRGSTLEESLSVEGLRA